MSKVLSARIISPRQMSFFFKAHSYLNDNSFGVNHFYFRQAIFCLFFVYILARYNNVYL